MKRYHYKRIIAAAMSLLMTASILGGCGKGGQQAGSAGADNVDGGLAPDSGEQTEGGASEGTAMGRYLEEVIDMSDKLEGYKGGMSVLEDGEFVITEVLNQIYTSDDYGKTWGMKELDAQDDLYEQGRYVYEYAVGADGTIGMMCAPIDMGSGGMAETDEDVAGKDDTDDEKVEDGEAGEGTFTQLDEEDAVYFLDYTATVVKTDGTRIEVSLPQEEECPQHMWIDDEGTVYVGTNGKELYEIAEDGSGKVYLTLEDAPQLIRFLGRYMIIDGWDYEGLIIYDREAKTYIEDEVLNDFVKENYGDRTFNGGSFYDLYFFAGEDDVLYLAGREGVHRHVIGGSAMEQIIDANLSTFGDPSYHVLGMEMVDNNEFVALFTGARLVRYTYDPTVPTVPGERVKAYSLRDNVMLRKAIALYQTDHPEVYVEYEIGMEDGSAVTREDALKKLNTEIMAGEGPDVLILDDMPANSYIEKGLLKDLTKLVDGLEGNQRLFDNIVDAFRQDGGLYMIPCEANLPTIMGKEKYVSQMTDLEGIADGIEELRQDNPQKDLLMLCSSKAIMRNFIPVAAPAWMTKEGTLDRDAIETFYVQMKRVYDAQMDGLPEEAVEAYEQWDEDNVYYYAEKIEDQDFSDFSTNEFSYLRGEKQIMAGPLTYAYAYAELTSVKRCKGFGEDIIIPMNGLCDNVFYANTLAAINASSGSMEYAEGLLRTLLGAEKITTMGFPVNRAAFEKDLIPEQDVPPEESYSVFVYEDGEGSVFTWEIYWFDEAQAEALRQRMQTVDTPYVKNEALEEAVLDAGVDYINGVCGLDEAVAQVEKNLSIYLAE